MASPDQTAQPWMAPAKKPIWKKWWFWVIVGFAALIVLTALFGDRESNNSAGTEDVIEELVPMPDLLGERLDVALSDLETVGISEEDVEVVGGGALGIIDESNWSVCEQSPEPGETTFENPRLIVDRTCPELVPMPNLLGERLDVALSDLGILDISEEDVEVVGGGALGIIDESNWIVCEQRPEPGETPLENPRLIVDRTCPE